MPFTAQDLIEDTQNLVTATPQEDVKSAIEKMIEHDFSQLPVVDDNFAPIGMITDHQILLSLTSFGTSIEALKVGDAMKSKPDVAIYNHDDDIFAMLERLRDQPAILIVNSERLVGIVTPADTTEYLRLRAEDMMLVEDIETTIKDHIRAAFSNPNTGELDEKALQDAIDAMSTTGEQLRKDIRAALNKYFSIANLNNRVKEDLVEEAFGELIGPTKQRHFADLTLHEFTELLLHKRHWDSYGAIFNQSASEIRTLLDEVRKIRNILAHFRTDLNVRQRKTLKYCSDWLFRNPPKPPAPIDSQPPIEVTNIDTITESPEIDIAEEVNQDDSRYARLGVFFQERPVKQKTAKLVMSQVEAIIGQSLPDSARKHRSWWANDTVGHIQSREWLDAGWRVASVNMTTQTVTFHRMKERETSYITFFNHLMQQLKQTDFPKIEETYRGTNWHQITGIPLDNAVSLTSYRAAFNRGKRFRVSLYIDVGDKAKNEQIFDELFEACSQDDELSDIDVTWERLESNQACRIAIYRDGDVESKEVHNELIEWATRMLLKLDKVFTKHIEKLINKVL